MSTPCCMAPLMAAKLSSFPPSVPMPKARSEERRVGKECRSRCDWSSDVCSSDLGCVELRVRHVHAVLHGPFDGGEVIQLSAIGPDAKGQIGRASCRERV